MAYSIMNTYLKVDLDKIFDFCFVFIKSTCLVPILRQNFVLSSYTK
jgi:hypothetical protein